MPSHEKQAKLNMNNHSIKANSQFRNPQMSLLNDSSTSFINQSSSQNNLPIDETHHVLNRPSPPTRVPTLKLTDPHKTSVDIQNSHSSYPHQTFQYGGTFVKVDFIKSFGSRRKIISNDSKQIDADMEVN